MLETIGLIVQLVGVPLALIGLWLSSRSAARSQDLQVILSFVESLREKWEGSWADLLDRIDALPDAIFIPEVFTPNGDGAYDTWQCSWTDEVDPAGWSMVVYNRSGGEVHRMPLNEQWDGGTLPDAVFWWKLIDE